ncbi:MAG: ribbon-helix-helix protein, CopG family [Burkholderiales bacterium]|nr:ribbon-helix-helix protein, CopG family [Phycisphaerae bacterium]
MGRETKMNRKALNSRLPIPYNKMSATDLERATEKFDAEFVADHSRALTPQEKKRHQLARRPGRPRIGQGAEKIRISMERDLLKKVDAHAARRKQSRSQLIAEAVASMMRKKAG